MNKTYLIFAVVVIIIGAILYTFSQSTTNNLENSSMATSTEETTGTTNTSSAYSTPSTSTTKPLGTTSKNSGRVVFTITDNAVSLENLQFIMLTVTNISVNGPGGWTNLISGTRKFDLLDLYR